MKKLLHLMVCLVGIVFLTSGCGVSTGVNITFDNHDNMVVRTDVKYRESEIREYVDLSELSPDELKPSFDVKAKGIKIMSRFDKLGKDLLGREQEGYTQVEECKHVSWGKEFTEISFFKPQRKGESILSVSNYMFFKKYKFAGKVVAPEQLIEKAKNTKFKDKANNPDSFLNASFSIYIPLQAKSIKTNSTMSETTNKNHSYFWSMLYSNEEDCNVNFEFILINWLAIITTIIAIIGIIGYFLARKFNISDWRTILKNTANGLNNLSNKEFSPQGIQTKLPVDTITPKTEEIKVPKKVLNNNRKIWLIVVTVLLVCGIGFYLSIPKICDILIQNSISSLYEGKAEKAIQLVEIAKTLTPKNNFANDIYSKGLEEIDKNNLTNAETLMNMALKLANDDKEEFSEELAKKSINALNKKQYARAKNFIVYAVKFDDEKPQNKKEEINKKCENLAFADDYNGALACTELLIVINPKDEEVYTHKGQILFNLNRAKESIDAYTKAINIRNNYATAYLWRGKTYLDKTRDYDKAIYDYKKVLELSKNQNEMAYAHYNLGIAYYNKKSYSLAVNESLIAREMFYNLGNGKMEDQSMMLYHAAARFVFPGNYY